jgi:hypothetical protein
VPVDLSLAVWIDRGSFLLPVLLLSQVGLAHYHLHQRLQPDPAARMLRAFARYLGALLLALSSWAVLQTISSILLDIQSPLLPLLLASFLTLANHHQRNHTHRAKPNQQSPKHPITSRKRLSWSDHRPWQVRVKR